MEKVYIIRWEEETDSGEYSSGICDVFEDLQRAQDSLLAIANNVVNFAYDEDMKLEIKTNSNGKNDVKFICENGGYELYEIEERNIK